MDYDPYFSLHWVMVFIVTWLWKGERPQTEMWCRAGFKAFPGSTLMEDAAATTHVTFNTVTHSDIDNTCVVFEAPAESWGQTRDRTISLQQTQFRTFFYTAADVVHRSESSQTAARCFLSFSQNYKCEARSDKRMKRLFHRDLCV